MDWACDPEEQSVTWLKAPSEAMLRDVTVQSGELTASQPPFNVGDLARLCVAIT